MIRSVKFYACGLSRVRKLIRMTLKQKTVITSEVVIRYSGSPSWPDDNPADVNPDEVVLMDGSCPGPQFTLTQCMLRQLRAQCSLTSLALQYCNLNCNTVCASP
jgi:hypothetical protein